MNKFSIGNLHGSGVETRQMVTGNTCQADLGFLSHALAFAIFPLVNLYENNSLLAVWDIIFNFQNSSKAGEA